MVFLNQKVYKRYDLYLYEGNNMSVVETAIAQNRGIPCNSKIVILTCIITKRLYPYEHNNLTYLVHNNDCINN